MTALLIIFIILYKVTSTKIVIMTLEIIWQVLERTCD